jgi:hypothetical protein
MSTNMSIKQKKIQDPTKEAPTRYWDTKRAIHPAFPGAFGGQRQNSSRYQHQHQHQQKEKPIQVDSITEFPSLLGDTTVKKERIPINIDSNGSESLLERLKSSIAKDEVEASLRRSREAFEEEQRRKNEYEPPRSHSWYNRTLAARREEERLQRISEYNIADLEPDDYEPPQRRYSFNEDDDRYNDI